LCEHRFEERDPSFPAYSVREVDLFPAAGPDDMGLSIRRNFRDERYEVFDFTGDKVYSDSSVFYWDEELERVVNYAEILEQDATGSTGLAYGCRWECRDMDDDLQFEL
jgi:hypothetical protein